MSQDKHQAVQVRALSDLAGRVIVAGEDSDRGVLVRLDPATGDLCVAPSGRSRRAGVQAVRWSIPFVREAALVLPCINGIFFKADREFPGNDRFQWPYRWNAQFVIAQRSGSALMVHSEDTACTFKALVAQEFASCCRIGGTILGDERRLLGGRRAGLRHRQRPHGFVLAQIHFKRSSHIFTPWVSSM